MAFRIEITSEADLDGEDILEWLLSQHAGDTGIRWFVGLEEAIASLATFPERCPIAPENTQFPFEVRQLLYGRKPHLYRVLFKYTGVNACSPESTPLHSRPASPASPDTSEKHSPSGCR